MLHRPMLVALIGQPTDDGRMIESVRLDPSRRYACYRPGEAATHHVQLRQSGDRIEAIVPRWWRTQLTLDLDPHACEFWDRPEAEPDDPPLWVFRDAEIRSLCFSGALPAPWAEAA